MNRLVIHLLLLIKRLLRLSKNNMITFINTFTVHPDKQKDVLHAIQNVYVSVVKQPGFISAQLLQSDVGARVTATHAGKAKPIYKR